MAKLRIRTAMVEATRVMSRHFAVLCTPLIAIMLAMRGLEFATHVVFGKREVWVNLLLLFAVCYPVSFFANCVVSAIYLRTRDEGKTPSLAQVRDVAAFRGLFRSVVQLLWRAVLWVIPLIVVFLLLVLFIEFGAALVRVAEHSGAKVHGGFLGKKGSHYLLLSMLVVYEGMLSRYTFVMPMIARARVGGKDVFEQSVRVAKAHWPTLWIGAMCLSALALGLYELMKAVLYRVSAGPIFSKSVHAVELLMVALISTWYWIFATILMLQATEPTNGLVSGEPVLLQ